MYCAASVSTHTLWWNLAGGWTRDLSVPRRTHYHNDTKLLQWFCRIIPLFSIVCNRTCISMGLPSVNHASGLSPLTRGVRAWHALVKRMGGLERFRVGSRLDKHTPSVWDTGKEISMHAADWALRKGGLPGPLRVSRGPSGPIGTRGFPAEHCWEVGLVQCPLTWSVTTAKH